MSALEHIVRSARKHGIESKVHRTPQATAASPNASLPYPIGTSAFYTTGEQSRRREEESTARRWSTGQASFSAPARGMSWTPHSSGTPDHLRNPVNLPDESTVGIVTPTIVGDEEAEGFEYLQLIEEDNGIEVIDSEGSNEKAASDERISPQQTVNPKTKQNSKVNLDPNDRQEPEDSQESEGEYETDRQELESEPEPGSESDSSEQEPSEPSENESDNDDAMANPPQPVVERGPSIRLPWFTGKEDEQVEKFFRELKRLKAIYKWQDDHLLNMSLLGLRGRADDWASALPDGDKDMFAKLKENMIKIFGDKRAQWQKHADFSSLKQTKEQGVIDFAGMLKQRQAKSEANPAMMLAVFLDRLKSAIGRQVAILDLKTFEEAVD